MQLNEEQWAAVESPEKNRLVLCGAGGGKTRTLCAAVAHEIETGTLPAAIVVATFTNAAAGEMETRLRDAFGVTERLGFVGTLHAFCLSLIREHSNALGLPDRLSVIDDDQKEDVLETVRAEMGVKCSAKKAMELLEASKGADPAGTTKEALLVKRYHQVLRASGLLDFDQILKLGLDYVKAVANLPSFGRQMCEEGAGALALMANNRYAWPFQSLYVDEAQDAAQMDAEFYEACPCARKFVVGDPDQSIYKFRGGNVWWINALATEESWEHHILAANYRSGSVIVGHAQKLIEHNVGRVAKTMKAVREGGTVEVHRCETPGDEPSYVLESIQRRIKSEGIDAEKGHPYWDYAVIARTNRLAQSVAQHLAAKGVPVRTSKKRVVPADWKRTKLLLSVLDNPYCDYAVLQLLRMDSLPEQVEAVRRKAAANMVGINESLGFPYGTGMDTDLTKHGVSSQSQERVRAAGLELSSRGEWTVPELLLYLHAQDEMREEEGAGVACCTVHSFKGREAKHVFLIGMEEGSFPLGRKDTDLAEERRLAYVGVTRAQDSLTLTWVSSRPEWRGDNIPPGPVQPKEPSRFLKEMELI